MKKILVVITGSRKKVLKETYIFNDLLDEYLNNICITIVTDRKNIGLFENINKFKNEVYAITPRSFLILMNIDFDLIINMASEELGMALINHFEHKLIEGTPFHHPLIEKPLTNIIGEYYFEEISHPIDSVHSKIRRNGKYLIGINIGENEDISKKLPTFFLSNLINKIDHLIPSKFVLFGTRINKIKFESISRQTSATIIDLIGLEHPQALAQAIKLCDIFISLDSFMMHLSLAIKQKTIGLFINTPFKDINNFDVLTKIKTEFDFKKECETCVDHKKRCPILYSLSEEDNCLYHFDENKIIKALISKIRGTK